MIVRLLCESTCFPSQVPDEPFHQWVLEDGSIWILFFRLDNGYLLRFPDIADFAVSIDGRTITAWPSPGISPDTLEHLYLNQVFPLALSRQGRLVLHASAVEINGSGVAFIGASGRGKSTLAASFASNGARFLTDDGLHIERHAGLYQIVPSHPSVRLWEDSQTALIHHSLDIAPPVQYTSKVRILAGKGMTFCDEWQPLKRVYFLGEGSSDSLEIDPIHSPEALIGLIKNSFLLDIEEKQLLAWHFDELVNLARLPIYYRLDYPRRYDDLPKVREAIARHVLDQEST